MKRLATQNPDWKSYIACLLASALVCAVLPALAAGPVQENVDYLPGVVYDDGKDLLDIYMPDNADGVPVVVYFHGGALRAGSKADARGVAMRLAGMGFGVVTPGYRLSPAVMHPAHVKDAAAATAWVLENIRALGGDPQRLYVAGHSAGAYLAALLTLDTAHLRAHGIDQGTVRGGILVSPFLYVEETAAVRPKDVWGENPADWLAASVTPHIKAGKPPMLLIYADGDEDWRKQQNESFGERMRAVGNLSRVVEVPDRDHMTLIHEIQAEDDQVAIKVMEFIREHR